MLCERGQTAVSQRKWVRWQKKPQCWPVSLFVCVRQPPHNPACQLRLLCWLVALNTITWKACKVCGRVCVWVCEWVNERKHTYEYLGSESFYCVCVWVGESTCYWAARLSIRVPHRGRQGSSKNTRAEMISCFCQWKIKVASCTAKNCAGSTAPANIPKNKIK